MDTAAQTRARPALLAGVLPPDSGEIHLEGIDVVAEPERAKAQLSYMPQRFGLYEDLTVAENIFFYGEMFGVPARVRRAHRSEARGGGAPRCRQPRAAAGGGHRPDAAGRSQGLGVCRRVRP